MRSAQNRADATFVSRAIGRFRKALQLQPPMEERRAQKRLPAHGTIAIMWQQEAKGEQTVMANVIDACENGLSVRSKTALPPGTIVLLNDGKATICGCVRHCSKDAREYSMGISIQSMELSSQLCLEAGSEEASVDESVQTEPRTSSNEEPDPSDLAPCHTMAARAR
jgi:hypothetical protein